MDGVGAIIATFIVLTVLLAVYFLPTIIAVCQSHRNTASIVVVNFFLGWTMVGWVLAVAWALSNASGSKPEPASKPLPAPSPEPPAKRTRPAGVGAIESAYAGEYSSIDAIASVYGGERH